jgi:hypothetical protein
VIRYPGGTFRAGDSAMIAVRDMKEKNPKNATIVYGWSDP